MGQKAVAEQSTELYRRRAHNIYDPTVPYNNHLISILLNQTITRQRTRLFLCVYPHSLCCMCKISPPPSHSAYNHHIQCLYTHTHLFIYLTFYYCFRLEESGVTAWPRPAIRLQFFFSKQFRLSFVAFSFSSRYVHIYTCKAEIIVLFWSEGGGGELYAFWL